LDVGVVRVQAAQPGRERRLKQATRLAEMLSGPTTVCPEGSLWEFAVGGHEDRSYGFDRSHEERIVEFLF
jgi:hypothetical protein